MGQKSQKTQITPSKNHKQEKSQKTEITQNRNHKNKIVSKRKYQRADVTKRCNHPNTCLNWNINKFNCRFINLLISENMQENITQIQKLLTYSLIHELIKIFTIFILVCDVVLCWKHVSDVFLPLSLYNICFYWISISLKCFLSFILCIYNISSTNWLTKCIAHLHFQS